VPDCLAVYELAGVSLSVTAEIAGPSPVVSAVTVKPIEYRWPPLAMPWEIRRAAHGFDPVLARPASLPVKGTRIRLQRRGNERNTLRFRDVKMQILYPSEYENSEIFLFRSDY
jgi:hypothetical protein